MCYFTLRNSTQLWNRGRQKVNCTKNISDDTIPMLYCLWSLVSSPDQVCDRRAKLNQLGR
jgi:hypothetical protein